MSSHYLVKLYLVPGKWDGGAGRESGRGVNLTTELHLALRLKMNGLLLHLPSLYA